MPLTSTKPTKEFRTYTVRLEKPFLASDAEHIQYVRDALEHYCQTLMPPGAYEPSDPGDAMYRPEALRVNVVGA